MKTILNSPADQQRPAGRLFLVLAVLLCGVVGGRAEEKVAPLRALLITGGCCHDYETQKGILTNGISARANVTWTVVHEAKNDEKDHEFSVYKKADWTKGFDVIVHNECSGKVTNVTVIERIVSAHKSGVPAVMIHCTMHSYRDAETDEWRKLVGVTSMRHQKHEPFEVKNLQPEHPLMKDFPASWKTPNGELYEIEKVWPNCKPLAQAYGSRSKKDQVCIWVNTYGKARVFEPRSVISMKRWIMTCSLDWSPADYFGPATNWTMTGSQRRDTGSEKEVCGLKFEIGVTNNFKPETRN